MVPHRLNCFVEVTCWNPLGSPTCGSWRTSLKLCKIMALYASVGLEATFRNSSTNLIFCGDIRIIFTLWKNGSQMTFPPPGSGEHCGEARAYVTQCLMQFWHTQKKIIYIIQKVKTRMLGLSQLPYKNTQVIPRTNRHYAANLLSAVKRYQSVQDFFFLFACLFLVTFLLNSRPIQQTCSCCSGLVCLRIGPTQSFSKIQLEDFHF